MSIESYTKKVNGRPTYSIRLRTWIKAMYEKYFIWQDANYADVTYVIGGNRPLHLNSLRTRFHIYAKKAGVKDIRIHDLRHSCASYLLNAIQTYAHLLPSAREKLHIEMNREAQFLQKCTLNAP